MDKQEEFVCLQTLDPFSQPDDADREDVTDSIHLDPLGVVKYSSDKNSHGEWVLVEESNGEKSGNESKAGSGTMQSVPCFSGSLSQEPMSREAELVNFQAVTGESLCDEDITQMTPTETTNSGETKADIAAEETGDSESGESDFVKLTPENRLDCGESVDVLLASSSASGSQYSFLTNSAPSTAGFVNESQDADVESDAGSSSSSFEINDEPMVENAPKEVTADDSRCHDHEIPDAAENLEESLLHHRQTSAEVPSQRAAPDESDSNTQQGNKSRRSTTQRSRMFNILVLLCVLITALLILFGAAAVLTQIIVKLIDLTSYEWSLLEKSLQHGKSSPEDVSHELDKSVSLEIEKERLKLMKMQLEYQELLLSHAGKVEDKIAAFQQRDKQQSRQIRKQRNMVNKIRNNLQDVKVENQQLRNILTEEVKKLNVLIQEKLVKNPTVNSDTLPDVDETNVFEEIATRTGHVASNGVDLDSNEKASGIGTSFVPLENAGDHVSSDADVTLLKTRLDSSNVYLDDQKCVKDDTESTYGNVINPLVRTSDTDCSAPVTDGDKLVNINEELAVGVPDTLKKEGNIYSDASMESLFVDKDEDISEDQSVHLFEHPHVSDCTVGKGIVFGEDSSASFLKQESDFDLKSDFSYFDPLTDPLFDIEDYLDINLDDKASDVLLKSDVSSFNPLTDPLFDVEELDNNLDEKEPDFLLKNDVPGFDPLLDPLFDDEDIEDKMVDKQPDSLLKIDVSDFNLLTDSLLHDSDDVHGNQMVSQDDRFAFDPLTGTRFDDKDNSYDESDDDDDDEDIDFDLVTNHSFEDEVSDDDDDDEDEDDDEEEDEDNDDDYSVPDAKDDLKTKATDFNAKLESQAFKKGKLSECERKCLRLCVKLAKTVLLEEEVWGLIKEEHIYGSSQPSLTVAELSLKDVNCSTCLDYMVSGDRMERFLQRPKKLLILGQMYSFSTSRACNGTDDMIDKFWSHLSQLQNVTVESLSSIWQSIRESEWQENILENVAHFTSMLRSVQQLLKDQLENLDDLEFSGQGFAESVMGHLRSAWSQVSAVGQNLKDNHQHYIDKMKEKLKKVSADLETSWENIKQWDFDEFDFTWDSFSNSQSAKNERENAHPQNGAATARTSRREHLHPRKRKQEQRLKTEFVGPSPAPLFFRCRKNQQAIYINTTEIELDAKKHIRILTDRIASLEWSTSHRKSARKHFNSHLTSLRKFANDGRLPSYPQDYAWVACQKRWWNCPDTVPLPLCGCKHYLYKWQLKQLKGGFLDWQQLYRDSGDFHHGGEWVFERAQDRVAQRHKGDNWLFARAEERKKLREETDRWKFYEWLVQRSYYREKSRM